MMETFRYQAINQIGRREKGHMQAANVADLERRLQQEGLDLTTVKAVKNPKLIFSGGKASSRDLVLFCFQLEQLMHAGVPILEGLHDLQESTECAHFRTTLGAIIAEVEGGQVLSAALSAHSSVFDSVFVSLITAGEQSGQLPTVLKQLGHTLRWQDALLAQTKRLLTYPLFIFIVVTLSVAFLMIFLVPELVKLMGDLGQAVPWNTQVLIWVSNAFVHYWWLLLSVPTIVGVGFVIWVRNSQRARYALDGLILKLPVVGHVLNKIIMARFSRYFALMYAAGIPILSAINTCESIVDNQVIARALRGVHDNISAGRNMSDSFQQTGLFPSLVIRMVKVGERTGALDQALLNISHFYDRDVDERLQSLLKLLEPALTVILGLVLMFVMSAVLGPVYNAFSQMPL